MNSLANPHYKLQEHRLTNEDSFHSYASQRNTQSLSLMRKLQYVTMPWNLKDIWTKKKKYNWYWVPYSQITALIQSLNCHMLCSKESASSLPQLSRNNCTLQLPSWAFKMFHKGLVSFIWWKRTSHNHSPCKFIWFLFLRPNVERK